MYWDCSQGCDCCPYGKECKSEDSEYPIGTYDYDDDMLPFDEFQKKWEEEEPLPF